ncbi:alcohol dehydrogenase catalytic domain-containing protein [Arthrobacter sp.]|uniref:alcohol dehydrogenase catalytic domain-containing protein n=1 Tax=Arthrobacter sp. TaxID=1667 RepID=UPI0028122963|nr:alcohol dehydrogenase catalytic domain-containing protein [Arthrobacter sp.]
MRAIRFHGKHDLRLEEVPEPTPGAGQVKLRIGYAGICGSDLHTYYSPEHSGTDYTVPHPVTGAELPQILGHEFAGEVVDVGSGVSAERIGQRVAVWPIYGCGHCFACDGGTDNACIDATFHGVASDGGGFSEFTVVPESQLHVLPAKVDLKLGALVEPMAVAWHAARAAGDLRDRSVLVIGGGPIGIGLWHALRLQGAAQVVVSEPSAGRRDVLAGLGAELLHDPFTPDAADELGRIAGGGPFDAIFDAAGSGPALNNALPRLRPLGTLVVVALHEKAFDFDPTVLVLGERRVLGVHGYTHEDYDQVIDAMSAGHYRTDGWVETAPLTAVESSIHGLRNGDGSKILIEVAR